MIPRTIDMLRTLVSTPSVSCTDQNLDQSNIGVINHLANWLDDLGFDVIVKPLDVDPNKANLVAQVGSGEGGLVFAGHSDTVPCAEANWNVDPYSITEQDDRYYGLGTCDMKGFFPIVLSAFSDVNTKKVTKPLSIAVTSDEETGMAGARELKKLELPKADAVVIGEPTDLVPAYTHKGIALIRVTVHGTAGHSSDPEAGVNAIDVMHEIIKKLTRFRSELKAKYRNVSFSVPYPTLNLGCLHAGDAPNRICEHAELQFDIRILPNMDSQALVEQLRVQIERIAMEFGAQVHVELFAPIVSPFETSATSPLIRKLEQASGTSACGVPFGTEAPFYQELGMEAVVFGPGSVAQAHQPDEYLSLERVEPTKRIVSDLIHSYCFGS